MSTTAIIVYCPRCDYFLKTAVQTGHLGVHGCAGCSGVMEVFVPPFLQQTVYDDVHQPPSEIVQEARRKAEDQRRDASPSAAHVHGEGCIYTYPDCGEEPSDNAATTPDPTTEGDSRG